jgi:hypothetical protein
MAARSSISPRGSSFAASASWAPPHRAVRLHRRDARPAAAYGLFSEIISWKLRFFVPVDANGSAVLGKLLDRYPVARIGEREAA